jgi:hypothetical protein
VIGTSVAHAQAPGATPVVPTVVAAAAEQDPPPGLPIAIATNAPFNWGWSVAVSAWVGLSRHFALRANFARYGVLDLNGDHGDIDDFGNTVVPPDFGHTVDFGVGLAYYSRRVLDGATFELGAVTRLKRRRDRIDDQNNADDVDHTTVVGTRLLVGWTWRLSDHWFTTAAVGGSLGYERGSEKRFTGYLPNGGEMTSWSDVSRASAAFEYYLRVGAVFGQ